MKIQNAARSKKLEKRKRAYTGTTYAKAIRTARVTHYGSRESLKKTRLSIKLQVGGRK